MLVEKNITVFSTCEHHLLPIYGKAHVAYFSNGNVIGLSKMNRIVDYIARRPQLQERLNIQIVKKLQENKVEVRPMICGSMGTQPFYVKNYGKKVLPNSSIIDKYGFYIPNHPGLNEDDILKITNIIKSISKLTDPYLQTR